MRISDVWMYTYHYRRFRNVIMMFEKNVGTIVDLESLNNIVALDINTEDDFNEFITICFT